MSSRKPKVIAYGFKHFRVENNKRVAVCKICGKQINDVISTTSNFVRHLKSHKESFTEYQNTTSIHIDPLQPGTFQLEHQQIKDDPYHQYEPATTRPITLNPTPRDYSPGPGAVTPTAVVRGPARCVLLGERPALNCLARASGIATRCSKLQYITSKAGWQGQVAGTRKTTPGFRLVEKYAMLVGGVSMHRQDLSGMVMLKDNHVWASGSITQAVMDARAVCGFSSKIEVECGSREEGSEAAAAGADIVMLDNFKPEELCVAARLLKEKFPFLLIEASGGVTPSSLLEYLSPHVDIISLGCITQGCPIVDFSLKVHKTVFEPFYGESKS